MIVQHNIMAINSHRQLGINNTNLQNNLEKLSSGYRINRAADDAAGLAISEKMRAQITGLDRAILNAKDGASLIQTAEGALNEVHTMLNRMVELATQSANGTIQESDRYKIEAETTALKEEIDRISQATNFNGIQLLDGSLSTNAAKDITIKGAKVDETAAVAGIYDVTMTDVKIDAAEALKAGQSFTVSIGVGNDAYEETFTVSADGKNFVGSDGTVFDTTTSTDLNAITIGADKIADAVETQMRKTKLNDDYIIENNSGAIKLTNRVAGEAPPKISDLSLNVNGTVKAGTVTASTKPADEIRKIAAGSMKLFTVQNGKTNESTATFEVNGNKFLLVSEADAAKYAKDLAEIENRGVNIIRVSGATYSATDMQKIAADINQKTGLAIYNETDQNLVLESGKEGNGLTMQVGDTAADYNKITVSVDDMSSAGLGIQNITMTNQTSASAALDRINKAIEKVSVNRGNLGALQNRLNYTINNLGVTTENMTAAESRVRDVDMAKEMMQFTKNNVLSQAAQAMLAQANMQPQNVLQLLR